MMWGVRCRMPHFPALWLQHWARRQWAPELRVHASINENKGSTAQRNTTNALITNKSRKYKTKAKQLSLEVHRYGTTRESPAFVLARTSTLVVVVLVVVVASGGWRALGDGMAKVTSKPTSPTSWWTVIPTHNKPQAKARGYTRACTWHTHSERHRQTG